MWPEIVACWAPDGVMLPPAHPAVHGTAAIGEYFRRVFSARRLTFTFTDSSVHLGGGLAIERLHYTVVGVAATGETTEDVGKGVHIYARQADGAWQLILDVSGTAIGRPPTRPGGKYRGDRRLTNAEADRCRHSTGRGAHRDRDFSS